MGEESQSGQMSITRFPRAFQVLAGQPGSIQFYWRQPDGTTAIDITGFTTTAKFISAGEETEISVVRSDDEAGSIKLAWDLTQGQALLEGLQKAVLTITETSGAVRTIILILEVEDL